MLVDGDVTGLFTVGDLIRILSAIPADYVVDMTMNEEYLDRVGRLSWCSGDSRYPDAPGALTFGDC